MAEAVRFENRVAVITGSGGGLGRAYALYLAARGSKVLVNDLGTSMRGEGISIQAADQVVEEIRRNGGEAIANYDSVTDGDKIIKAAIDKWGRIDILINNAGILRDVSFQKMTDQDWNLVKDVHLNGSYKCTKSAWEHMKNQNFGRIIMITSSSGLYGNFGQSNYSAAKLALVGLTKTLALEGVKFNIRVNAVAPLARSRMTESSMPPELIMNFDPEYICPLIAYLVHEKTEETGSVFEVGAGWITSVRWERTKGVVLKDISPEAIRENWNMINDFTNSTHPSNPSDSISLILDLLNNKKSSPLIPPKTSAIDFEMINKYKFPESKFTITHRDVILYALSVGEMPVVDNFDTLSFTYENHPEFQALPSMGVIYGFDLINRISSIPGLNFDPMMLLHSEQYIRLNKVLPTSGTLTNSAHLKGIYDKGKSALVILETQTKDERGDLVCTNEISLFIRGIGGFGGERGPSQEIITIPSRPADKIDRFQTNILQAVLYRLSGDYNPLHIDPNMSNVAGFKRPILHGLCSFGIVARAVLRNYCNNDSKRVRAIKARFTKHVFPGETLATEMWHVSPTRIVFQTRIVERNEIALSNGFVDITPVGAMDNDSSQSGDTAASLKSTRVFKALESSIKLGGSDLIKSIGAVYQFDVISENKTYSWTFDLKNDPGSVSQGKSKNKSDVTLIASDEDFVAILTGKISPQMAFTQGKIKIRGNISLALKLDQLIKNAPKL